MPDPTAFLGAIRDGDTDRVARMLDENPRLRDEPFESGASALTMAARLGKIEIVKLLLRHGASLQATPGGPEAGSGAPTPLMDAAATGEEEAVALLLQHGADPSVRDRDGLTAADYARRNGHDALASRLGLDQDQERVAR